MRLPEVGRAHTLNQRIVYALQRFLSGGVAGPVLAMSYRREVFGEPFSALLRHAMRLGRHWPVRDTELMAAFISKQFKCAY